MQGTAIAPVCLQGIGSDKENKLLEFKRHFEAAWTHLKKYQPTNVQPWELQKCKAFLF